MRFLSVCSGIEAASVAWRPLGWEAAAFAEIEPFPCSVLAHHYPTVPNWGDMTKYQEWPDVAIDLLCGGTPCQSFSVAGLRAGLADPRGNLMLTFGAIAAKYRPRWLVWENVPGVLSSNAGRDFGSFLGLLGQLGYGFAYRVLDAQYFGVPQRRRRVFVVGCLGDWRRAAAVLFERHSLSGHPAPRREAGQGAPARALCSSNGGIDREDRHTLIAGTLQASGKAASSATQQDAEAGLLVTFDTTQVTSAANRSNPQPGDPCHPMAAGAHAPAIAYTTKLHNTASNNAGKVFEERAICLDANSPPPALLTAMQVRRLTPEECEALQGFPRGYTAVPHRGKPAADGPRYKALGNSWAVPCARWIGQRIQMVDAITELQQAA